MQPSPRAETSRSLFPSLRFCMVPPKVYLALPTGSSSSKARDVDRSRYASICAWRSATLFAALGLPPLQLLRGTVGVVLDGRLGVGHRRRLQELGAEEPRVDDGGGDAEGPDLLLQRIHPALDAELRRGICRAERKADQPRG